MTTPLEVADRMVVALASEIFDGDLVGVGLGTPLALAAALLAKRTHAPGAHVLAGGALDADADLATYMGGSRAVAGRTPGWVSHFDSMDMAERQAMTLQILRPGQVDGSGNLNTSRIGGLDRPAVRFPGGLATADVAMLLPRIVAYLPAHRARNLPERASFITGDGAGWSGSLHPTRGVVTVVTDLAVIHFGSGVPRLASVHPWADIDHVVAETGFTLDVSGTTETRSPTEDEHRALRALDPDELRAGEVPMTARGAA